MQMINANIGEPQQVFNAAENFQGKRYVVIAVNDNSTIEVDKFIKSLETEPKLARLYLFMSENYTTDLLCATKAKDIRELFLFKTGINLGIRYEFPNLMKRIIQFINIKIHLYFYSDGIYYIGLKPKDENIKYRKLKHNHQKNTTQINNNITTAQEINIPQQTNEVKFVPLVGLNIIKSPKLETNNTHTTLTVTDIPSTSNNNLETDDTHITSTIVNESNTIPTVMNDFNNSLNIIPSASVVDKNFGTKNLMISLPNAAKINTNHQQSNVSVPKPRTATSKFVVPSPSSLIIPRVANKL